MQRPKTILNPNKDIVKMVREGLKKRGGYCPCSLKTTEEYRCPCKVFRETGDCHCQLYVKEEEKEVWE